MENSNYGYVSQQQYGNVEGSKSFIANVFSWMAGALAISGIIAYQFGTSAELLRYLVNAETGGLSGLGYVVMFAPLAFVLVMNFALERLSTTVLTLLFMVYAVLMGMSLSFIFLAYTAGSIYTTFGIAAGMFGLMALAGYTTKTDLSKMGTILFMAVIGMVIASIVNMFLHSSSLDYGLSFIGVIVFTGLTAYKVQMLKELGQQAAAGSDQASKLAIWGALSLYITFVNLFLSLLRLFGDRR